MSEQAAPAPETTAAPAAAPTATSTAADVAVSGNTVATTGNKVAVADSTAVAAAPTPEPDTTRVDVVAEVMKRRDTQALAGLVREKRQLEAERAKYKEHEPKLTAFRRIEQLLEEGDDATAIEELIKLKSGDKHKERLATTYNALTDRILKGHSEKQQPSLVERSVSRLEKQLEELQARETQAQSKLAEREAAEQEQRAREVVTNVSTYLKGAEQEYPFLMAEADEPGEVVWAIMEEAEKLGQELTLGEAAKLANTHFQPTAEKKADRYKNLLAPKGSNVPIKPEAPTRTSAPPRKSLTNADASQAPVAKELPPPRTQQERVDRAFAVLQRGGLNK